VDYGVTTETQPALKLQVKAKKHGSWSVVGSQFRYRQVVASLNNGRAAKLASGALPSTSFHAYRASQRGKGAQSNESDQEFAA